MLTKNQAIKDGKRNVKDSELLTVDLNDLATSISADAIEVVERNDGGHILRLMNSKSGDLYLIGFGKSVAEEPTSDDDLAFIIDNYEVFTGNTDREGKEREIPWFSFGKANAGEVVVKTTVAALLAKKGGTLAGKVK